MSGSFSLFLCVEFSWLQHIIWWKFSTWNADSYQILTRTFNRIRFRTTPQGTDLRFPGHGPVYGWQGVFLYSCSHTGFVFFLSTNKSLDASVEVYSSNYIHMLNTLIFLPTMVESLVCFLFTALAFFHHRLLVLHLFSIKRISVIFCFTCVVYFYLYIPWLLILSGRRNCLRWLDAC